MQLILSIIIIILCIIIYALRTYIAKNAIVLPNYSIVKNNIIYNDTYQQQYYSLLSSYINVLNMMQTLFTTTDNINTAYTNILNMQFNIASIVNPLMPSITYAAGGTNLEYTYWFGNYPLAPPINGSQLLEVLYPNYSTILNNLATILSIANVN